MRKRPYSASQVNDCDIASLRHRFKDCHVVIGVDIAKVDNFCVVMDRDTRDYRVLKWSHPHQMQDFCQLVRDVHASAASIVVALEPTGTYADPLRQALADQNTPVALCGTKRVHDAREIFDGVPSTHDAKAAYVIAMLHINSVTAAWTERTDDARRLNAGLALLEVFRNQQQDNANRLEALLGRYWPELTTILTFRSVAMLALLETFGGPAAVASAPDEARELMRKASKHMLADVKIESVIHSAQTTTGVRQADWEVEHVRAIAEETNRNRRMVLRWKGELATAAATVPEVQRLRPVVGLKSAVCIYADLGSLALYSSSGALLKKSGLNLTENTSGSTKDAEFTPGVHISKRGSGRVRRYLYMAVLRLIQSDPIFKAWYAAKLKRDGGRARGRAIVALMRKLLCGLRHVADGQPFKPSKLFDISRLETNAAIPARRGPGRQFQSRRPEAAMI